MCQLTQYDKIAAGLRNSDTGQLPTTRAANIKPLLKYTLQAPARASQGDDKLRARSIHAHVAQNLTRAEDAAAPQIEYQGQTHFRN